MGLASHRRARRARHGGRGARLGHRGHLPPQDHGALRIRGRVDRQGSRPGGRLHGHGRRRDLAGPRWTRSEGPDDATLAGQGADHVLQGTPCSRTAARHVRPHDRHVLPRGRGRHLLHPRPLRRGKDRLAADHRPLREGGHRGLRRVRRTRRRGGGDAEGVPRARRPAYGQEAHGPHRDHLQHVLDAGRLARGLRLHGGDARRILPPDGPQRTRAGGLHKPLGAGHARTLRASGGDSRRRGVSGVSRIAHRRVLSRRPAATSTSPSRRPR